MIFLCFMTCLRENYRNFSISKIIAITCKLGNLYNIFGTSMKTQQTDQHDQLELNHIFTKIHGSLLKVFQDKTCKKNTKNNVQCIINNVEKSGHQSPQNQEVYQKGLIFQEINRQIYDQQQLARVTRYQYPNIQNIDRSILFLRLMKKQEILHQQRRQKIKNQYGDLNKVFQSHKIARESLLKQALRTSKGSHIYQKIQINLKNEQKISLIGEDIEKLKQNTDLNDAIIQTYLKIMKSYIVDKCILPKIFFYSTYFLSKLLGDGINDDLYQQKKCSLETKRLVDEKVKNSYNNVKRWTKNEDIFSKDILIFPINYASHWNCIFVLKPSSLLDNKNQCQIIYCDSMFQCRELLVQFIRCYLRYEIQHKKGKYIDVTPQIVPSYQLLLPRQPNHHDCGLFMLLYIQQLLINHTKELNNLRNIKNRHKLHLFPIKLIMTMRHRLLGLFLHLSKSLSSSQSDNIIRSFLLQKDQILSSQNLQYQAIDEKQYKKYLRINNFKRFYLSKCNNMEEQSLFIFKIRFYLDPQINYYIKNVFE